MNDHSMFVGHSTKINSAIADFSVIYIKTVILDYTASLGEWCRGRPFPFDLRGRVTYHVTVQSRRFSQEADHLSRRGGWKSRWSFSHSKNIDQHLLIEAEGYICDKSSKLGYSLWSLCML